MTRRHAVLVLLAAVAPAARRPRPMSTWLLVPRGAALVLAAVLAYGLGKAAARADEDAEAFWAAALYDSTRQRLRHRRPDR